MKGLTAKDFPWSQPREVPKRAPVKPKKEVKKPPDFPGVVFEVHTGSRNFTKKLPINPGAPLKVYLRTLRLKRDAAYHRTYDKSNLPAGKLRSTYIPTEKSVIIIGASVHGMAARYQRSDYDTGDIMRKMK